MVILFLAKKVSKILPLAALMYIASLKEPIPPETILLSCIEIHFRSVVEFPLISILISDVVILLLVIIKLPYVEYIAVLYPVIVRLISVILVLVILNRVPGVPSGVILIPVLLFSIMDTLPLFMLI
ncbi:hypothetical protein ALNOE001_04040 [Candidatus Methanobinarius endosymbioticus]|uniref:Uncharacterized protein n=1 Tax=Candidatus Methanobinarius endosymbioticus TaxID=2006182 RepID=A0A366MDR2_9EURY|nr:hypothetical protein ALNOE001_04040 [Candidatus Methanobinarius endosymbioticus]